MQRDSEIIKLSELKAGQSAILIDQKAVAISMALLNMGCIPGEELVLKSLGLFGDPIAFLVNENKISIRREDARSIKVRLIPDENEN